jgi:hypothetical protein
MKNILIFLALLPILSFGQCGSYNQGVLKIQVHNDTVILQEDTAVRNCGSMYQMKIWFIADTLYWLQSDTGINIACMCNYNYSVTIDSLKTGHYIAKVFFTEYPGWPPPYFDTCYVGSIPFEIVEQNSFPSYHTLSGYQSDCFPVGIQNKKHPNNESPFIYPNPTSDLLNIFVDEQGETNISIYNINNQCVLEFSSKNKINSINVSNLPTGFYIVAIKSHNTTVKKKFCKL